MNIVCPSGLAGEIRAFKAKEANLLANQVAMKKGTAFGDIIAACWLSTSSPGPYTLGPNGAPPWHTTVLVADRFEALLRIREATYGSNYEFDTQCVAAACREPIQWELSLSDLPVKALPASSVERIAQGKNRFEAHLPSGRAVWFQLQDAAGEARATALLRGRQDQLLVSAVASRILEIEGVPDKDRTSFIEELDMGDVVSLLDQFDAADGGVETNIEVECKVCRNRQVVQLPLGQTFFLPKRLAARL